MRISYVKWFTVEFLLEEDANIHVHGREGSVRKIEDWEATMEGLYSCKASRTETSRDALEHVTRRDVVPSPAFFCSIQPFIVLRSLLFVCIRNFLFVSKSNCAFTIWELILRKDACLLYNVKWSYLTPLSKCFLLLYLIRDLSVSQPSNLVPFFIRTLLLGPLNFLELYFPRNTKS